MDRSKVKSTFSGRLRKFVFDLLYHNTSPETYQVFLWIAEKVMALSFAPMYIFFDTPWNSIAATFQYLKARLYFDTC